MQHNMKILYTCLVCLWIVPWQNGIKLGDLKVNAPISKQQDIREFYQEVLNATVVTPDSPVPRDYVQFDNGIRINVIYQKERKQYLTPSQSLKAPWIKLTVTRFGERRAAVINFGAKVIKEVPHRELYFQSPDGLVYRMVKAE